MLSLKDRECEGRRREAASLGATQEIPAGKREELILTKAAPAEQRTKPKMWRRVQALSLTQKQVNLGLAAELGFSPAVFTASKVLTSGRT